MKRLSDCRGDNFSGGRITELSLYKGDTYKLELEGGTTFFLNCALVADYAREHAMVSSIAVDAEIENCRVLSTRQVEDLSMLEPFGAGNPRPVFLMRSAAVIACGDVGGGRHMKLKLRRDGVALDAIFFAACSAACGVSSGDRLDLIFTPQINEFRGNRSVQLQICDVRPAPSRYRLERELFHRLEEGELLSRWEAGLMLPQRRDFAQLWRFLEGYCAAGPAVSSTEHLLRQITRGQSSVCSYGRALVCLQVLDDTGLIRVTLDGGNATVELCRGHEKVDLEQAGLMRRLRGILK